MKNVADNAPLKELEEWDEFVATRYQQGKSAESQEEFQKAATLDPRLTPPASKKN